MKMRKGILMAAALGIMATLSSAPAEAVPVFGNSYNYIYFNNVENWVDTDGSQNISAGDQFYGILHVQNIDSPFGSTIWNEDNVAAGGIDTFTGYFLNTVTGVTIDPTGDTHIALGTSAVDPNGIISSAELASGVVMKLYTDDSLTAFSSNGTLASSIASATDGTLWATFTTNGGYWYTHAPIVPPTNPGEVVGDSFFGLNVVTNYSTQTLLTINDPLESESNLSVNLYGTSNLNVNLTSGTPWMFTSNDPSVIATPEPGTFLLLGSGLLGLGLYARRRMRK